MRTKEKYLFCFFLSKQAKRTGQGKCRTCSERRGKLRLRKLLIANKQWLRANDEKDVSSTGRDQTRDDERRFCDAVPRATKHQKTMTCDATQFYRHQRLVTNSKYWMQKKRKGHRDVYKVLFENSPNVKQTDGNKYEVVGLIVHKVCA